MWPRAAAEEGKGPPITRSGLSPARLTQVRVKGKVREAQPPTGGLLPANSGQLRQPPAAAVTFPAKNPASTSSSGDPRGSLYTNRRGIFNVRQASFHLEFEDFIGLGLESGHTTMPGRMDIVPASPQVEADPSMAGEVPSAELETQAVGRMVQLENEVLMLRQEINEHTQQLSKLDELKEIKEILRAINANQVANPRPAPAPPSQVTPPPRPDKQKGVLGGPPSADPTPPPWHMQAGPSRPQPGWNPEHFEDYQGTNGGHNGQHVDPTVNIGGPGGHHNGYNGNNGGQQHSTSGFGNRETYGPQASQYGSRFPGTQWENANPERRWARYLKIKEPVQNWEDFKAALLFRFGPSAYVDFDIDLRNLKQTSTVQDYQEKFEDLACMVDWTPKALIAAFVGGLKDEIQIDVRAERITELKACFAKAQAVEERMQKKQELYRQWRAPNPIKGREAPQRPKPLPAPTRKEDPKPVFRSRVPPNMTREEREELSRNKKCYWCKDDWDPSHRCKNVRVYTVEHGSYEVTEGEPPLEVEVIDEPEIVEELLPPEEVQPSPEGTIHMMNDPQEPDAMKVVGRVGNLDVLVLLDSGATHNFVGEHIANRLGSIVEE
ncbi:hypothetical protein EJ110_NYTH19518 [Nymphaea thermarum]|nr:hypothetical protein EJ110_NYTH19518 [Nymphaea thermarum]